MDDLPLDGDVLVLLDLSFLGNILNLLFGDVLGNVLPEILDGVVVDLGDFSRNLLNSDLLLVLSDLSSSGDSLDSGLLPVLDDLLLEGHVFDPALALDDFLAGVDDSVDNLGLVAGNHIGHCVGSVTSSNWLGSI